MLSSDVGLHMRVHAKARARHTRYTQARNKFYVNFMRYSIQLAVTDVKNIQVKNKKR
jgi:outer membrane biogenesis lipoprotein LolB